MPATSIANDIGSSAKPDSAIDASKPYPALVGVCRKAGTAIISEYMPKPNSVAAMFVHHTVGMRIMRTSTSGWAERSSTAIQTANSTTAPTNRPITRGDVQPQFPPWLTPSSRHTSQPERVSAAEKLTRPGALIGDSGIRNMVATIEIRAMMPGIQNSQW